MNPVEIVLIAVVALGGGAYIATKLSAKPPKAAEDQSLLLLQNQMSELTRTLDTRLGDSGTMMHTVTKNVMDKLSSVSQELVRVGESNKQVVSIADQLKRLQDILKNPKQRGTLGEYHLEAALKNTLASNSYQLQYPFNDGTKVDAVIFYAEKTIPIDSKFSLENYMRFVEAQTDEERARFEKALALDLKVRIDETSKYIKPDEGTMDFAFMFIPSEGLYYDLLINKVGSSTVRNLVEYAVSEKRVHIVSPTTIYAYLQTILQGLRQAEISKSAEKIKKNVGELAAHLGRYDSFMQKLGAHMQTSTNMYNSAYREFKKIDKDVYKISGASMETEPLVLTGVDETDEEGE
jgi:DNA recombination protein RmuC